MQERPAARSEEWFESWFGSPYYRLLYSHRDYTEAEAFIETLLAALQPPAESRMLDIACGEGRHAVQLSRGGFDVTGIDLSHESIAIAQTKETPRLHFYVHDMRHPFYVNYFDYAFNFFTSFGYFRHRRDHALAARAFTAGLKPGGTLVIDYLNKHKVIRDLVRAETIQKEDIRFEIRRSADDTHIVKRIAFADRSGAHREYEERVAAFTQADFERLFADAGCRLERTFGDYKLQPFDLHESPRLIMVFKKEPYGGSPL